MTSTISSLKLIEPDYISLADFERNFDLMYWRKLFRENWIVSVYLSVIYIVFVFGGVVLMKQRKPFKLNGVLTVWNIGLSALSICASYRIAPEFFNTLFSENGIHYSVCEWRNHNGATAFWGFLLVLSKVVEFGDTAFVVLRKQNLKFIHYYHHIVTAISWWFMYSYYEPIQIWVALMNALVHSLMYPYYTIRSMKIKLPKMIAMLVTSVQLLQMFVGLFINLYTVWLMYIKGTPADCPHRYGIGLIVSLATYVVFVFLFAKFFIDSYIRKGKVKPKTT